MSSSGSAASGGRSGDDDPVDWESLQREEDDEELALHTALQRSRVDKGGSSSVQSQSPGNAVRTPAPLCNCSSPRSYRPPMGHQKNAVVCSHKLQKTGHHFFYLE